MSRGLVDKSTGDRIPTAGNIVDKVGDLTALHTTAKNKAVNAINEVADAVSAINDGTSIDSFADVENALSGKQNTITAGNDLKFSGSTLDVEVSVPYIDEYDLSTDSNGWTVVTKKHKGEVASTNTYQSGVYATYDIDGCFKLTCTGSTPYWQVVLTKASTDEPVGTSYGWGYGETPAVSSISFELAETGTASEFIAALYASINGLTLGKQDKFESISYADWQLLTPQQQAAKPYYIHDYPSTEITAGNVGYINTQSGMSANKVQGAIDELASGKQPKTDNNLTTTSKETTGAINELKSGLMNLVEVKNSTETVTGVEGAWVYLPVTFDTPFKNKPLVTVNTYDTGSGNNWWPPMLKDITKNGFTAGWYNANGTKNIIWQAIGIKGDAQ